MHPRAVRLRWLHGAFADYEQLLMGTVYFTYRPQRDPGNGKYRDSACIRNFEFIMRTGATLILPVLFGENGILFAEVLAWMGADLVLIPGYLYMRKSCFRADRTRVMFKAQFEVLRKRKTSPTAGGSGWKLLCRRAGFSQRRFCW